MKRTKLRPRSRPGTEGTRRGKASKGNGIRQRTRYLNINGEFGGYVLYQFCL